MTHVDKDASVHPRTVTEVSRRELDRRRTRRFYGKRASAEITTTQVHPMVWAQALRAADGDASRIEVIDEHNVTIHNDRDWRG